MTQFRAVCKSDVLKSLIDAVSTLVDEVRLKVQPDGLYLRAVDAAHVAMVDLSLSKSAFKNFEAEETEIGIDVAKLSDSLKLAKSGDEVEMKLTDDGRLMVRIGNLVRRMSLLETSGMTEPKVPNLDLPCLVKLVPEELERGIKAAEGVSDHVALACTADKFELTASGDMDSVNLSLEKKLLLELEAEEDIRSLYSLDYFTNMIKATKGAGSVTLHLGNDYPVKVEFSFAEGAGHVTYLLAPRIESV